MRVTFSLVLASVLAMSCSPSVLQTQAKAARGVTLAVDALTEEALTKYETDQRDAKDTACEQAPENCADEARKAVLLVRADWELVWELHDALRLAQETWVQALTLTAAANDTSAANTRRWWVLADEVYQLLTELLDALKPVGVVKAVMPTELKTVLKEHEP
jgi:hypothetical protein